MAGSKGEKSPSDFKVFALVGTLLAAAESAAVSALYPVGGARAAASSLALLGGQITLFLLLGGLLSLVARRLPTRIAPLVAPLAVLLYFMGRAVPHWRSIFVQDLAAAKSLGYLGLSVVLAAVPALLVWLVQRLGRRGRIRWLVGVAGAFLTLAVVVAVTAGPGERGAAQDLEAATPPSAPAGVAPETVVILTFDALRADHLSSYGYHRPTSPELDRFFGRSLRFSHALAPKGHTGPSLASLLTGLYPPRHGALRHGWTIAEGIATLPRLLPPHFVSAAFVANPIVQGSVEQAGFDEVVVDGDLNAEDVVSRARRWVASQEGHSIALWVHIFEPHGPYLHQPADLEAVETSSLALPGGYDLEKAAARFKLPSGVDQEAIRATVEREANRYDASIRYATDAAAAFLQDLLSERGDAFVVVSSDHGESIVEHDFFFNHGALIYQPVAHIPFAVHWPSRGLQGVRDDHVSLVDVLPTICGAVGCVGEAAFDGVDLLADATPVARPVYSSGLENPLYLSWAIVEGDWKLIATPRRALAPLDAYAAQRNWFASLLGLMPESHPYRARRFGFELFDLSQGAENTNLAASEPERVALLRDRLSRWLDAQFTEPARLRELGRRRIPENTVEQLRALGYVQ